MCEIDMKPVFAAKDYRRANEHKAWGVAWCDQCGYGRVSDAVTPEEVSAFYRTDYYTHTASGLTTAATSLLDKVRIHLAWRFDHGTDLSPRELAAPGKLCDIGCGNGVNLGKFKDAGFHVVGVEPDEAAREVASQIAAVHAGTGESLPEALQNDFDYVLLSHVLEHTISPSAALANARSLLKDDGVLIIEVPNNEALGFKLFAQLWPWTDVPRHIHFFTGPSLRKLLETEGFRISETRYVGYTRQFRNEWIADQKKIWSQIGDKTKPQPDFRLQAWWLLLNSLFATNERKYDSIRIHATKVSQ
jgi:2-polyprenyl-3-methyl-5-hydroxy-6-metoxy-1,4-benzoquinol methylase